MSGHTAGPWIYAENGNVYANDYRKTIVRLNGPNAPADDIANARLIASAPRMYDWMMRMAPSWDDEAREIMAQIEGGE